MPIQTAPLAAQIDPSARIDQSAHIGADCVIKSGACIGAGVSLGVGVLVDANAVFVDAELPNCTQVKQPKCSTRQDVEATAVNELHATLSRVKPKTLDSSKQRRTAIAQQYLAGLSGLDIGLPQTVDGGDSAWRVFVIRHPQRDALARQLAELGIGTVIHYLLPPHLQAAYAELALKPGSLPLSEAIHREVLSLPLGPAQSDADTQRASAAVRAALVLLKTS